MIRQALGVLCFTLAWLGPAAAQDPQPQTFDEFLAGVRAEALGRGISQATLDAALAGVTAPEPAVVEQDRNQPEEIQSLEEYVSRRLTEERIRTAREQRHAHGSLLGKIEAAYGVPPPVIVAIWGLESNFGRSTGTHETIRTLATLAYDSRRQLFRAELFEALAIVEQGVIPPAQMKGSWAGAMGQPQFIPSSYRKHAVDFDGDGRADIWSSLADVFGSIANYLKSAGWRDGERWGREVRVSRDVMARIDDTVPLRTQGCRAMREMTVARPLSEWSRLGVTLTDGTPLPTSTLDASLVRGHERHFLVYRNYKTLLAYNCSNSYGISVGTLADRIAR